MSMEAHIKSLQYKKAEHEASLLAEMARPNPDFYVIKDMKKQKLVIKEEISRLLASMNSKHKNAS